MSTNLIKRLQIDPDDFSFIATDTSDFIDGSTSFTMIKDKRTMFLAEMNGETVECYVTLRGGNLTNLSRQSRTAQGSGDLYQNATGVISRMQMDLTLMDGDKEISFAQFGTDLINAGLPDGASPISVERFIATASRLRLDYGPGGSMPLFWFHPGTNLDSFKKFTEVISRLGAAQRDDIAGIDESWDLSPIDGGLAVRSLQIGSVDRERSITGQGFQDFFTAQVEHLQRVVSTRRTLRDITTHLNDGVESGKLTDADVDELGEHVASLNEQITTMNRRAGWGGTQQGSEAAIDGSRTPLDQFYSTQVPCGRIELVHPADAEKTITMDLWTRGETRAAAEPVKAIDTTKVIDTTVGVDDDEDEAF